VRPVGTISPGGVEVTAAWTDAGAGRRLDWSVRNPTSLPVAVDRIGLRIEARPDLVLEHGWQSWSVVRSTQRDDVRPERAGIPSWAIGTHVADPAAAGKSVNGDQFLVTSDGAVGFLSGARNLGTVEVGVESGLTAWALLEIELQPDEERHLDPLWLADGEPAPLYSEYCGLWGAEAGARISAPSPLGWCSWYQYFHAVIPDVVRSNLALAADHGIELVQIDDGFQAAIGDWLDPAEAWAPDIASMAEEIRAAGVQAGIWTAPFLAGENSRLVAEHPDWLVRFDATRPLKAAHNRSWGGFAFALDTTNSAVLAHIRDTFSALRAKGFDYFKIDFCYAAALAGQPRSDPSMTRAQALRAGLEAVRAGIGDDAFLLGCGCPFGPAVGVVDAMRVSADVAPQWEPSGSWPGFVETAPAAVNAIQASRLRAPLHRRVWINDPDCLLLRPTDTKLTEQQRLELDATVVNTGAFVVLSDDLSLYGDNEWRRVDELLARRAEHDHPIDIDPFTA
jgi:alpha-galactosidase